MTAAPPEGSGLRLASADANILVHLQRANGIDVLDLLFERVHVEDFIRGELARNAPDVMASLFGDAEARVSACLCPMNADAALPILQRKIYRHYLETNRDLFNPQDRGELVAISLAAANGARFVLTDDTKHGGPYWWMSQGVFGDLLPLRFHDVLLLACLAGRLTPVEAGRRFEIIMQKGYDIPPRAAFPRDLLEFLADISGEPWFAAWRTEFGVGTDQVRAIARELAGMR